MKCSAQYILIYVLCKKQKEIIKKSIYFLYSTKKYSNLFYIYNIISYNCKTFVNKLTWCCNKSKLNLQRHVNDPNYIHSSVLKSSIKHRIIIRKLQTWGLRISFSVSPMYFSALGAKFLKGLKIKSDFFKDL
jgi:hypothetical protein